MKAVVYGFYMLRLTMMLIIVSTEGVNTGDAGDNHVLDLHPREDTGGQAPMVEVCSGE